MKPRFEEVQEILQAKDIGSSCSTFPKIKEFERERAMEGQDLFSNLPEGCISHVLSLTSPPDVCRSSAVCSIFRSASESDIIWERFLPSGLPDILNRSVSPIHFSSKKDLFFRLLDPILIDEGKMSFSIERKTGSKCYMLSPRELWIAWGGTPRYWKWISLPQSRFSEVAELLNVCWLEISGKIDAHILSPKTTYKAYLVFNIGERAYRLEYPHAVASVKLGGHESNNIVFLQQKLSSGADGQVPQERSDGWMEIEMGSFFNDEGEEGDVEMNFKHVMGGLWKRGLIVEGIEIRPVCN